MFDWLKRKQDKPQAEAAHSESHDELSKPQGSSVPHTVSPARISILESAIMAAQESGDYMPAYQLLVNTDFFVPVLRKDQGATTKDFRYAVRGDLRDEPVLVISEELARLHAQATDEAIEQGTARAIKMRGSKLITTLHPEVGIIVALSNGGFGMPAKTVAWLKKSMQPA